MTAYYRKNFSSGIMSLALKAAPDYPDDPRYDEIAVGDDHTLPDSSDTTLTKQFRLVIWSGDYANPGDDPSMEIVTATRTAHPLVYQIVTRGEENTAIAAHPIGCNVGLHYTAGVSNADLETILAILEADEGSLVYSWTDIFGNKQIGVLAPGEYGQVLVTAGSNQRPYWDWVWLSPGAGGGMLIIRYPTVESGSNLAIITMDYHPDIAAAVLTEHGSDLGPNEGWFLTRVLDGSIGSGEDFGSVIGGEIIVPENVIELQTDEYSYGNLFVDFELTLV